MTQSGGMVQFQYAYDQGDKAPADVAKQSITNANGTVLERPLDDFNDRIA